MAPEKSLALWLHYLAEGEQGSRGGARVMLTLDRLLDAPAGMLSHVVAETRFGLRLERSEREAALGAILPELRRFDVTNTPAAARLSSGIDAVLEDGYQQLGRLSPGADPRRAVEAIAQAAQAPLQLAIPPWLAQELARGRLQSERQADALREAAQREAALEAAVAEARRAATEGAQREAGLARRIDALTLPRENAGRDARVDEVLTQLKNDVARVTASLADQPEREHRLISENAQLQRDLADERNTIARLSEAYERERATAEHLAHELSANQAQLETFAAEVQHAREAERAWNDHGAALKQDLDSARDELHRLGVERDAVRNEREGTARQLAKLREELDSARMDLRIVDNDRNALAARAQAVSDAAAALREELARRAEAEKTLVAERDKLAADLRQSIERIAVLERELAKRIADLAQLSGRHESLGRTLSAVQKTWMGRRALAGLRRNGS
jgi:DNA repair exonuclease SbcCD ATPase subunit